MCADVCADAPGYERHDESCFHNRHDQVSCRAPRMRNTASVSLHCNGSRRHLSLFAVNSVLLLQFRGSSSDVNIRGFSHRPRHGKRRGRDLRSGYKRQYSVHSAIGRGAENAAGEISARDTNGSIACIGNYSNSTGCS